MTNPALVAVVSLQLRSRVEVCMHDLLFVSTQTMDTVVVLRCYMFVFFASLLYSIIVACHSSLLFSGDS